MWTDKSHVLQPEWHMCSDAYCVLPLSDESRLLEVWHSGFWVYYLASTIPEPRA